MFSTLKLSSQHRNDSFHFTSLGPHSHPPGRFEVFIQALRHLVCLRWHEKHLNFDATFKALNYELKILYAKEGIDTFCTTWNRSTCGISGINFKLSAQSLKQLSCDGIEQELSKKPPSASGHEVISHSHPNRQNKMLAKYFIAKPQMS